MKRIRPFLFLFLGGVVASSVLTQSYAQVNPTITYQGFLADDQGNPIDDPDLPIRFTLHDALTGGALLWNEAHGSVAVTEGVFTVQLGSFEPLDDVPFEAPLFLAVTVGTIPDVVTLEPRIPLTAVGYSLRAKSIDDGALVAGGNVRIDRVGDALQISAEGGDSGSPSALSAPDGNPSQALVVSNAGQVGVGTPVNGIAAPLHVRADDIGLSPNTLAKPSLAVEARDASVGIVSGNTADLGSALLLGEVAQNQLIDLWSISREPTSQKSVLRFAYGSNSKFSSNETKLALTTQGFVGIGTDVPQGHLHLRATGDTELVVEADADNSGESDNPTLILRQDGNAVNAFIGLEGKGGGRARGTLDNAFVIGSEDNDPALQFVTDDEVRMTIGTDGSITRPARSKTHFVTGGELLPQAPQSGFQRLTTSLVLQNTGKQTWLTRVHLPDGAVVTKATSRWVQSSFGNDTEDMTIRLIRVPESGLTSDQVTMAVLDGQDSEGAQSTTDSSIQAPVIDNRNIYQLRVEFPACPNAPVFNSCFFSIGKIQIDYTTTAL